MHQVQMLHQIEQAHVKLDVTRKLVVGLPDLRGVNYSRVDSEGDVGLSAPYDSKLIAEHRQALEKAGWVPAGEFQNTENGHLTKKYRQEMVTLRIHYYTNDPGARCTVRQIGTDPRPIVEVVCGSAE